MERAQLSERHLTLVFHLRGAEQEGISGEEMAGTGKTNACVITTVRALCMESYHLRNLFVFTTH